MRETLPLGFIGLGLVTKPRNTGLFLGLFLERDPGLSSLIRSRCPLSCIYHFGLSGPEAAGVV